MAHLTYAQNERNVVILTGIGHFSTHFFELMFPTLAAYLAMTTGFPLADVLGWSFYSYLLFGLGALPAGWLGDRLGARFVLVAASGGMGVFAIAAGEVSTGTALTICLAGMGLCASAYHPVGMSLITRTVAARGRALGVNGIFGNFAIALTPAVTAALCETYGWRAAFEIAGYTMCVVTVGCAFLPIEDPANPAAAANPPADDNSRRSGLFALLLVAATLAGISYRGNTLVQPAYFAERVPMIGYGLATSLVYMFGIVGQYVGGHLADRHDLRWLYFGFHALALPPLIAMTALSGVPLLGGAALFVFFSLGMQPIENSLVAQVAPARWRGTAYGMKFVLTFGVGALGVRLVQWAQSTHGLSFAIACLAAVVVVLLIAIAAFLYASNGAPIRNQATPLRLAADEPGLTTS